MDLSAGSVNAKIQREPAKAAKLEPAVRPSDGLIIGSVPSPLTRIMVGAVSRLLLKSCLGPPFYVELALRSHCTQSRREDTSILADPPP